jgi:AcrR family transcriptional regulator
MKISAPKTEFGALAANTHESGLGSRDKLLKSAEKLFAAKGFREVSVREIAMHAGVNSALVGYYFRGKQALFNEVYRAHAAPLAQERMKRLSAVTAGNRKPSVEEVLKAWLLPWLQVGDDRHEGALHVRFTANLSGERWEHTKKASPFVQRTHNAFISVFHQCLPHLSRETLIWRLHFVMGAIAFGIRVPGPLRAFSKGRCDPGDFETILAQILPYAVTGFCAPEPVRLDAKKQKSEAD